jgi:hypothetical protein
MEMRRKVIVALVVAIVLSFALLSRQSEAAKDSVTVYEYQVLPDPTDSRDGLKLLNDFGAQGWEIVGVSTRENQTTKLYLKRTRKSG